jgi:hypothetical protein
MDPNGQRHGHGRGQVSDLVLSSLVRARFCALIAPKVEHRKSELYLMGLLSRTDAILEVPIGVVIDELPLDHEIKAQRVGWKVGNEDNPFSHLRFDGGA